MAIVYRDSGKVFRISLLPGEGINTYVLGDAQDGTSSAFIVTIWAGGTFAGSIAVLARPRNPEAAQPVAPPMPVVPMPFQPIPYRQLNNAGAAVSPPSWAAGPIIGTCILEVPASGLAIALDVTALSAGEAWIFWTPVCGQAIVPT